MRAILVKLLGVVGVFAVLCLILYFSNKYYYPNITFEQYDQLNVGMTLEEVTIVLGTTGKLVYDSNSRTHRQEYKLQEKFKFKTFYKSLSDPPQIVLTFVDDRLDHKSWLR